MINFSRMGFSLTINSSPATSRGISETRKVCIFLSIWHVRTLIPILKLWFPPRTITLILDSQKFPWKVSFSISTLSKLTLESTQVNFFQNINSPQPDKDIKAYQQREELHTKLLVTKQMRHFFICFQILVWGKSFGFPLFREEKTIPVNKFLQAINSL